ncbi:MAG: SDR family oxidoreductase [Ignavibacteria bacterium]|nr:SDR family oxidoreductase [Ignavibacteria bacterium]
MPCKKVLLTGASGGIGKHIISDLAAKGMKIALQYNTNPEKLTEHLSNTEKHPDTEIKSFKADITSENEVLSLIENVKKEFGSIDILINNAGLSINAMTWKMSLKDWNNVLSVNLTGSFLCTKHVIPVMKENNFGRIIYISSVVPQIGVPGTSAYAASKAGIAGLCKTVSKEVIKNNITVNMISLGYFEAGLLFQIPEDIRKQIKESIPIKKFGDPAEISECINYICSEKSSYLTGQSINLNGGLY